MNVELPDVIQATIDRNLNRLYTAIPAIITDVSKLQSKNTISVQPAVQKILTDGFSYDMAVLPDVPVQWSGGGDAVMTFPLKVGDDVLLVFSMVSRADWWLSKGVVTPFDRRLHNLSDAFAIPKIFREGDHPEVDPDNIEIKFGDKASISITPEGDIKTKNAFGTYDLNADGTHSGTTSSTFSMANTSVELVDILSQVLTEISNATTNTMLGAQPFLNKPAIQALITQLNTLKA